MVGAFLVAREAARRMGEGSAIVINASVNALRAEREFADYNASKAAVLSLSQTMAVELAARGITVSAICPGYIPTPMTQAYLDDPETSRGAPGGDPGRPVRQARGGRGARRLSAVRVRRLHGGRGRLNRWRSQCLTPRFTRWP